MRWSILWIAASLFVLFLAAPVAAEPDRPSRFTSYAIYEGVQIADLVSTEYFLGVLGKSEANPVVKSRTFRVSSKLLMGVATAEFDHLLMRKGHKKTAWFLRLVVIGLHTYVVRHNLKETR